MAEIRDARLITKRTSVPGKIPTGTTGNELNFIKSGELASNLADHSLWGFDGTSVFEYGSNSFLGLTGGTISGNLFVSGNLSATTIYSGGTDLYDIFLTAGQLSGTSVSAGSNISVQQTGNDYKVSVVDSPSFNQLLTSGLTTINASLIVTGNTILKATSATTYYVENNLQFNTGYTGTTIVEGMMQWDEDNQTVSLGLHNGVSMQLGQETYYLIKNQSGATLKNGRVIRAAGTLGSSGRILGQYMIANGTIPAKYTLGIATEDIINGDDGYVTEFGLVRGINTTGSLYGETWAEGDVLWVSTTIAGGLTNVEPQFPNFKIEMAIVVKAASNGSIFVRPHRYPSTNEIQDIISSGKTNNSILQYSSTLSGYTNTTTPSLTSISATTISGGTIFSGNTNLYDIFEPINKSPYNTFILTAGTSYSFTGTVNTVSVNKTTGSATHVNLPSSPVVNNFYIVKDRKGDSVLNPITVSGGTKTIDGNTSYQIKANNKPSLTFLFDGQEYIVI